MMFIVTFQDGTCISEADVGKWDNVPRDKKIVSIGVIILSLPNGHKFIVSPLPKHCGKYCCTKLVRKIIVGDNGGGQNIGYVMYGMKCGQLFRIELTEKGLGPMQITQYNDKAIAKEAWRDGC